MHKENHFFAGKPRVIPNAPSCPLGWPITAQNLCCCALNSQRYDALVTFDCLDMFRLKIKNVLKFKLPKGELTKITES